MMTNDLARWYDPTMGLFDRFRGKPRHQPITEAYPQVAESRGPITTGAAPPGYVSPYLNSDRASELLVPGESGMPPLYFTRHANALWLAENTTGMLVNVANRNLRRLNIWSCRVRGDTYSGGTLRLGFVELVREPKNPHDTNAVAIHQDGIRVGYFNRGISGGLAKVLDRGDVLQAIAISVEPPKVVATDPETMQHLNRRMKS
jgi:hypothetical protein